MRFAFCLIALIATGSARAETLEDTKAFDRAFAMSFYTYDACGDGKHGIMFRKALAARFAQCPFSPGARAKHRQRDDLQTERSHDVMNKLIDTTGGVPVRLPGMEETCRQQRAEPDYLTVRAKLDKFMDGGLKAEEVLPAPCDSDLIAP